MFDFVFVIAHLILKGEVIKVWNLLRIFLLSKICSATFQNNSNLVIIRPHTWKTGRISGYPVGPYTSHTQLTFDALMSSIASFQKLIVRSSNTSLLSTNPWYIWNSYLKQSQYEQLKKRCEICLVYIVLLYHLITFVYEIKNENIRTGTNMSKLGIYIPFEFLSVF